MPVKICASPRLTLSLNLYRPSAFWVGAVDFAFQFEEHRDLPPIIDIHIHINPHGMVNLLRARTHQRGCRDYDDAEKYAANPAEFLKFMDSADIERAGLINYVSPDVIGFTPEVNDWVARYCSAAPQRLLAFGSVHPRYVETRPPK